MLAMGKTKPLRKKAGIRKKKVVIIACCWVVDMVEIKSPVPKVESKNRQVAKNKSRMLPLSGMPNQKIATKITANIWPREIII